ncbi:L-serine dehydratase, iron-sulfur-dependent, alpha subunit [uncultured spirochete]|uniref:L-serine dehydratase n=1 Tax=uncultured spirochete TaxID=156406 RepID=A0A3P3XQL5_9SPIR|nr:L-serine dehydratase, iron-sulfur-dependent, alpha subunit [uncultured spirochete]
MDDTNRLVSLFDTLGPIMTGPSSSHTAGVLRIGRMGRMLFGGTPEQIDLYFYGHALAQTYKGHLGDSAIVAGLLGHSEDYPALKYSLQEAEHQGISVACHTELASKRDPNTVDMRLRRGDKEVRVVGITLGGGEIEITELEQFPIHLKGDEVGVLILVNSYFDDAQLHKLYEGEHRRISVSKKGDETLYTCLLDTPLLPEEIEHLRAWNGVVAVYALEPILDYRLRDAVPLFSTVEGMLAMGEKEGASIPQLAIMYERRRSGLSESEIRARIGKIWQKMKESLAAGAGGNNTMLAGFIPGNNGWKMLRAVDEGITLSGPTLGKAIGRAIAVMETNACAKCVVAAPTAGSCGVLPGVLTTAAENLKADETTVHDALLSAAMMGTLVSMRASLSGTKGGCQAEIGVASAMAASALVQLAGGSARQVTHAMALAIKNILGLICDPVAGPVEIPCIKRNSIGVANAFATADMSLAGIESAIPPDEVIDALVNTQKLLPSALKGTMIGGLGSTPTAQRLKKEWDARVRVARE